MMKKIIKSMAALGVVSFILGLIVSAAENRKEIRQKEKNREGNGNCQEERTGHCCYGPYEKYFKRPIDFALALFALVVLSPVMAAAAVLVKVRLGSPVIFSQERPGKDERIFRLYKFRSMSNATDDNGNLLPDSMRITRFGSALRSTSIDELPELFNILKGDMSIVGPRPLAVQYLPYYNEEECHRHDVLPGLTGLAQIHGRNISSWEERFYYDCKYVNKITFIEDMKIILMTIKIVLKRSDIGIRGIDSPPDFDEYRRSRC